MKIIIKKRSFVLMIFLIFFCLKSQSQVVGSFYQDENDNNNHKTKVLKVEYNENISFITGRVNQHKGILCVSDDFSFYRTEFNVKRSDIEDVKTKKDNVILIVDYKDSEYFYEIIVNIKEKKLTEYLFERLSLKDYFAVYETQPEMKWELLDEEKQINNYNCKKAKTTFRGRSYHVWYTPEISISVGPWKFSGLPGLILSVTDITDNFYSWEVTSIKHSEDEYFDFQENIDNKSKFKKISYQDFDKKFIEARKDEFKAMKARVSRDVGVNFGFSTTQNKEPINEWRTQTNFEF